MTQMEKNSDIVIMHAYAPLLVNVSPGARQWRPNLIGYDALRVNESPSYHAIKMFSTRLGDEILKTTTTDTGVLVSATRDSRSRTIHLKLVNPADADAPVQIDVTGGSGLASTGTALILTGEPTGDQCDRLTRARGPDHDPGVRREIGVHLHGSPQRHRRADTSRAMTPSIPTVDASSCLDQFPSSAETDHSTNTISPNRDGHVRPRSLFCGSDQMLMRRLGSTPSQRLKLTFHVAPATGGRRDSSSKSPTGSSPRGSSHCRHRCERSATPAGTSRS